MQRYDLVVEVLRIGSFALQASELAVLAQVCHSLHDHVQQITLERRLDVSRGLEPTKIRVQESSLGYPLYFIYTRNNQLPAEYPALDNISGCTSCRLEGGLCRSACPCNITRDGDSWYTDDGLLRALQGPNSDGRVSTSLLECGPACSCKEACLYRRSQQGLQVHIELIKDARKGWSAVAAQPIAQGTFVCQYAGELLSNAEAKQRLASYDRQKAPCTGHALLVVREWLPSCEACLRINIDATRIGNVARFFNHSCGGGNLELVIVRRSGSPIPHVAMFARRHIAVGEELTFLYGQPCGPADSVVGKHTADLSEGDSQQAIVHRICYCGANECLGFLPSDFV